MRSSWSCCKRISPMRGTRSAHAADGEAALRLAAAERPAIILLDVMMPGIDGIEVLRRLREDETTRAVPVIMLTARQYQDDVVTALTLGAGDYVVKPFTPEMLLARVERILGKQSGS